MKSLEQDKQKVINIIKENFEEPLKEDLLWTFLTTNSKQIRIVLPVLYFKSIKKRLNKKFYTILAIGEMIHNASLLHDDVIDNAETRRGSTTINRVYSNKISILCGDYLLSLVSEKILSLKNEQIINIFNSCIKNMSLAEIQQFFLRGKVPELSEYIKICTNKTAILFEAIFKSCAILYDIDYEKISEFARIFGIYFQLKNDIENNSAIVDKTNNIYTIKDILNIENRNCLLDNYRQRAIDFLAEIPNNIYKKRLEDLINAL